MKQQMLEEEVRNLKKTIAALTAELDQLYEGLNAWPRSLALATLARAEAAEAERDALTAENRRLREALIEERTETLWNAYNTGAEQDGRWRHMCMSDGEWLARECGLDASQADYPADVVKGEIPLAAERFVAALKGEQK